MEDQPVLTQGKRPDDEVSVKLIIIKIKSLNQHLFRKWKVLLLAAIIGGGIGVLYAMFKKTVYTAQTTFVLQDDNSSGGGLSQYSALASIAGIDVGGSSGLFQGDNIVELYKSRLMLERTLLTTMPIQGKPQLLIERFIQINDWRKKWADDDKLKNINFAIPKSNFTMQHDSVVSLIVKILNKSYLDVGKPDKLLSIISVKVNATDPFFAKAFTEALVANVNSFYVQTKIKGSLQNLKLLQHQSDSIKSVLNSSISGSAAAMDYNPNPNTSRQILRVPSQRKQIDVAANTAIYSEVAKNLEIARGALQHSTPLIQVIDTPVLPLPNDKISKLVALLTGAFICIMITLIVLIVNKGYSNIMKD